MLGRMAEITRHTCTPDGRALPFGRKAEPGACPRCDELRDGAAPRSLAWVDDMRRREAADRERDAHRRQHFAADGPHARGECGRVCTAFDW